MYHKLCFSYNVSHIMYRISCIAYNVLHIVYRISCFAYPVSHILYASHGRPRGTRSHERPREATGGHRKDGRPRAEPHRPPQNIIPTKLGRPTSPYRADQTKPGAGGHGGPRGATARHQKSPRTTTAPLQYPRGPLQAAPVWGTKLNQTKPNQTKLN